MKVKLQVRTIWQARRIADVKNCHHFITYDETKFSMQSTSAKKFEQQAQNNNVQNQRKYQEQHFVCNPVAQLIYSKAVFIVQQILNPIEMEGLLDLQDEQHIEFLFLICVRSRNYLNTALALFSQQKQSSQKSKDFYFSVEAYLQKCKSKFKIYDGLVDATRNKLGNKLSKFLHITKSIKGKQLFLDGYEGTDYLPEQQIEFTYINYIQIILNAKEIKSEYFMNHRLKKCLKAYRKICNLTIQGIEDQKHLKARINQIIISQ